jgi:hypothetical protein
MDSRKTFDVARKTFEAARKTFHVARKTFFMLPAKLLFATSRNKFRYVWELVQKAIVTIRLSVSKVWKEWEQRCEE